MELLEVSGASAGEFLTNAFTFRDSAARQSFFECTQQNGLVSCFGSGAPLAVDTRALSGLGGGGSLVLGLGLGLGISWAIRMLR